MAKSVSASLRQLLQKGGDALKGKRLNRDEVIKQTNENAAMRREAANRSWGDTKKDK